MISELIFGATDWILSAWTGVPANNPWTEPPQFNFLICRSREFVTMRKSDVDVTKPFFTPRLMQKGVDKLTLHLTQLVGE